MTANPDSIVQLYNGMGYEEAKDSLAVAKEWLVGKSCIKYFTDGKLKTTLEKGAVESIEDQCTGEKLCSLLLPTRGEIVTLFQSSTEGHKVWSDLLGNSRGNFLSLVAKKLEEKKDLLSEVEAMSMGSNVSDVKREEVLRACSYFHYYATWAHCIRKDVNSDDGVVLVTLPSPAPLFALAAIVAPALAAGNAVVLNPCSWAPLSALLLAQLCSEARLPAGVVNVLPGPLTSFKEHLSVSVRRVMVWGSKLGCQQVFDQLAAIPVPLFPFFYGKAVSIIFDSSDKTSAIDILLKNMNFGYNQSPWSVRTVLVEEAALEWVATALKQRLSKALVGSSRRAGVDVGVAERAPSEAEQLRLMQALNEMNTRGVEVYQHTASSGIFFPPTLLIGSDSESNVLVKDYDVLPFVSVVPFRRAKDAIAFANKGQFGVAASVWTSCLSLALHMAENLQVGTVWINDHGSLDASIPFPNKKHGFATFGGIQGLQQLLGASRCLMRSAPVDEVMKVDDTKRDIVKEYCPIYGGSSRSASGLTSFYVPCAQGGYFQLSNCDWNDVRKALDAARTAGSVWAKQSPSVRSALLASTAERMHSSATEFLNFFSSGGAENIQLVEGAIDALHSAAFTCNALSASECTRPLPNTTVHVVQKPRGVVGVVTDSSSDFQMVVTAIAAAISYGNSVVVIPDPSDPVPTLELCALLNLKAPGGLINVIPSKRSSLLPVLASERDVEAIWYIGDNADSWKLLLAGANKAGKLLWKFQNDKEPLNNSLQIAATLSKAVWMPCENVSC